MVYCSFKNKLIYFKLDNNGDHDEFCTYQAYKYTYYHEQSFISDGDLITDYNRIAYL